MPTTSIIATFGNVPILLSRRYLQEDRGRIRWPHV